MDDATPAERARRFAEGARANYEREGDLAPMVALCADTKTVMVMAAGGTDDQPSQFGAIVALLAGRIRPHTVITVAEGWKKAYQPEDRSHEQVRRGDLGRMAAAGDATVQTCLMINAWRLDVDECHAVLDTVTAEPARDAGGGWQVVQGRKPIGAFAYDRFENEGLSEGHMADRVLGAWRAALEHPAPAEVDDVTLYESLGMVGLAGSVSVQEWDDDQPASE